MTILDVLSSPVAMLSFLLPCVVACHAGAPVTPAEPATPRAVVPPLDTTADIEAWKASHSNWGKWGKDDQRGSANYIDAAKRVAAARLVREGLALSLEHPLSTQSAADVQFPLSHEMLSTGEPGSAYSADRFSIAFHGFSHTHVDALCHIFDQGKLYNGYAQERVTREGCEVLSIDAIRDGIVTRGVLIDIPAMHGHAALEPGTKIDAAELDRWEAWSNARVERGDAVVIRTGRWARRTSAGPWDVSKSSLGLNASGAAWLGARGVALVATDVGAEVLPSGVDGEPMPVHVMLINTLGTYILDDVDPENVAKAAAVRHRVDFLFVLAPLDVPGGTGSPVNPLAIF